MRAYTLDWYRMQTDPLPADFAAWVARYAAQRYLFYKKGKRRITARCSACRASVTLDKVFEGRYRDCPSCGASAKMTAAAETAVTAKPVFVQYAQKCKEVDPFAYRPYFFMARTFQVCLIVSGAKKTVTAQTEELEMDIFRIAENGYGESRYSRGGDFFTSCKDWRRGAYRISFGGNIHALREYLYGGNLQDVFKDTLYEYSSAWDAAKSMPLKMSDVISVYRCVPQIEYLTKLGCTAVIKDIFKQGGWAFDLHTHDVIKFLRLKSKHELDFVIKHNLNTEQLTTYKALKKTNKDVTPALIDFTVKLKHTALYGGDKEKLIKYIGFKPLFAYYTEQQRVRKSAVKTFIQDYCDYIRACEFLQYNMRDTAAIKPKDFYAMHDRTLAVKESLQNKEKWDAYAAAVKGYTGYEYCDEAYSLVVPQEAVEVSREGKTLGHCVGSYISRVAEGGCLIAFVRKNDALDKPFVTVELSTKDNRIVQSRGAKNAEAPREVKAFLTEWLNKVVNVKKKEAVTV